MNSIPTKQKSPAHQYQMTTFVNFVGEARPPFDGIIQRLASLNCGDQAHKRAPAIVSVDIPSGWHVDEGEIDGQGIKPDMLVCVS